MKVLVSICSAVVISFSSMWFLAGCAGSPSLSSSAGLTPPPATPAHATLIYVGNNGSNSGGSISGFRMNQDGTLTALPESPFSISGSLAVSGNFLLVADNESVTSYGIDPSSGSLTRAGTASVSGNTALTMPPIAADSKTAYVGAYANGTGNVIDAFSINVDGSLAAIPGSPFLFSNCGCLPANSIAVQNSMLFASGDGFPSGNNGALAIYNIQDGALAFTQAAANFGVWGLAVHPTGKVVYAVNGFQIEGFTFGPDGVLSESSVIRDENLSGQAVAIDPSGKFLAAVSGGLSNSSIAVYSIDPVTGGLTAFGAPALTGEPGGNSIAFDPSGRFILVTDGGIAPPPNDVMVFSLDPASGTLTKVQSAPTGEFPASIVIATF